MSVFINPTFWLAVAVFVAAIGSLERRSARLAVLLNSATRGPVLVSVAVLAAANLGARAVIGLAVPGDFVQEVVAARSFQNEGTLFALDINRDVAHWLRVDPPVVPSWIPDGMENYLRERQRIGRNRLAGQAHPPTLLLAAAPWIWLFGPRVAYGLIVFASIAAAVIASQLLLTAWKPFPSQKERWLAALMLVSWQPVLAAVRDGQVSVIIGAALVAAWSAARAGRCQRAGALVGIASALKLYPGVLLVLLALRRQAAFWAALSLITAVGLLVTAVAGVRVWGEYFASAQVVSRAFADSSHNLSLIARLAPATSKEWLPLWYGAVSAGLLAVTLRTVGSDKWGDTGAVGIDVEFGLFICLAMLLSPVAWHHYTFMLALPLTVALGAAIRATDRWPLACWSLGVLVLSVPDDVIRQTWAALSPDPIVLGLLSPGVAVLLLWASLIYVRRTGVADRGVSLREAAPVAP